MSDATGMSSEFVLNQFKALQVAGDGLTPGDFFRHNVSFDQALYSVPVVVADIRSRIHRALPICLKSYFEDFPELASHSELWQIFDAADAVMLETQGPTWRKRWTDRYPNADARRNRNSEVRSCGDAEREPSLDVEGLKAGDNLLDFRIRELIGRGTYGIVYLASNQKLGRDVALKITSGSGNEGRALARLNHGNIVRVYGEHSVGAKQILEMQYICGGTLADWIADRKSVGSNEFLDWARANGSNAKSSVDAVASPETKERQESSGARLAVSIARQLASALQHAHDRGILHQDIKPANILVDETGKPLLTDFNVAFIAGQNHRNAIGGTVNYMSPEQLRAYCAGDAESIQLVDLKSDLFSLGLLLLEMLGGQKIPSDVTATNGEVRARQLLAARIRSTASLPVGVAGVNHSLKAIVDKALHVDPDLRYQSAADLGTDLSQWLDGRGNVHASNPNLAERASRFLARERLPVVAVVLSVTAVVAGVFGLVSWEGSQLKVSEGLLTESAESIEKGRGAVAAEQLGNAKAQLDRLWVLPWCNSIELERIRKKAEQCSSRIEGFDSFRFSALFGQASLFSMHENESVTGDGNDLIGRSLDLYHVLSEPNWHELVPFSKLRPSQQKEVAEHISELMLVSMVNSRNEREPTSEDWEQVYSRLPAQHRNLKVFEHLRLGGEVPDSSMASAVDGFDCYLFGVWSTCRGESQNAYDWYAEAIKRHTVNGGENFWLRYRQGLSCQRLGDSAAAMRHYSICWGMRPDFAWIPFNMALVHVKLKQTEDAIQCLRRAIVLDPKLTAAYAALGAVYSQAGDGSAAAATYEKAISAGVESSEIASQFQKLSNMQKSN